MMTATGGVAEGRESVVGFLLEGEEGGQNPTLPSWVKSARSTGRDTPRSLL